MTGDLGPTRAVAVVLFDEHGRVLMVRQNYGRHLWGLPGGVVEPGETPTAAAIREAAEETGLTVELDHLIGLYHVRSRRGGTRFMFAGRIAGGEAAVPPGGEIAEVRWFPTGELPSPTTASSPFAIRDAVAGSRGVLRDIDAFATGSQGRSRAPGGPT